MKQLAGLFALLVGVILLSAWLSQAQPGSLTTTTNFLATPTPTPAPPQVKIGDASINVEIADTEQERRVGLSGRDSLAPGWGMLFVFETENVRQGFWMKNMKFPIDIIWINNNQVSQIAGKVPNPVPETPDSSLKIYTAREPFDFVLETEAGFVEKNGIEVGNPVTLSESLNK